MSEKKRTLLWESMNEAIENVKNRTESMRRYRDEADALMLTLSNFNQTIYLPNNVKTAARSGLHHELRLAVERRLEFVLEQIEKRSV